MSGAETSTDHNDRYDRCRQFVEALKLIEPFCVVDVVPGASTYETELDVSDIDTIAADKVTAEVCISKTSEELIKFGLPLTTNYGLKLSESSVTADNQKMVIKRDYSVFVSNDEDGTEIFELLDNTSTYVEDEEGELRLKHPLADKIKKLQAALQAGDEEAALERRQEANQLVDQNIEMKAVVEGPNSDLQRHLAVMVVVSKIYEKLGIQDQ